jgi:DNA mismatch repair protein MutL
MSKIHKLAEQVINQIAAGEVVERPASIIKELVENSIDAKSDKVIIELESGGKDLIKIIDNGSGVEESDLNMALQRHATSKINNLDDLDETSSLGFRGEALASIASVSKLEFSSYPKEQASGMSINQDGEIVIKAMPFGTQVVVRDLFYNTPARQKFLKTDATEYKKCLELIEAYCLNYPEIHFSLKHNSKVIFDYPKATRLERIKQVLGADFTEKLLSVHYEGSDLSIEGYIGKPELAKNKAYNQFFFINGRQIRAPYLNHAVQKAYSTVIFPQEKIPYLLWINLDPAEVDMNVHPRKEEARLHYQNIVYSKLLQAIKHSLDKNILTPSIQIDKRGVDKFIPKPQGEQIRLDGASEPGVSQRRSAFVPSFRSQVPTSSEKQGTTRLFNTDFSDTVKNSLLESDPAETKVHSTQDSKLHDLKLKPLTQLNKAYIICQDAEGLVVVDQHAAHERVLYAKLKTGLKSKLVNSQKLLLPIQIELSTSEKTLLMDNLDILADIGFDITDFGGQTVSIQAIPAEFKQNEIEDLIRGLIDDLESSNSKEFDSLEAKQEIVIDYAACRGAIKFGQSLTMEEMYALIDEMEHTESTYSCPHGRPSMIRLSYDDLEKQFKR